MSGTAVAANPKPRRWLARLVGTTVAMSVYASFALLDLTEQPDPGCILMCGHGIAFLILAIYGTPVLAIAAGLLALSRRTRPFAAGLVIGMIASLLAFAVWVLGQY